MPNLLHHLHLPGLTPYLRAAAIQAAVVERHLAYKAQCSAASKATFGSNGDGSSSRRAPAPAPSLLTFTAPPTYTTGRREGASLSPESIRYLENDGQAEVHKALRGGQTTFHGPGQLVAYLICDLRQHGLDVRSHVRLLEDSIMALCQEYDVIGQRREGWPGVWVGNAGTSLVDAKMRKIASVGVHMRRNVSSHGVALNVSTDLKWFERITACGLPGNLVTNMLSQLQQQNPVDPERPERKGESKLVEDPQPKTIPPLATIADGYAHQVAAGLKNVEGVKKMKDFENLPS